MFPTQATEPSHKVQSRPAPNGGLNTRDALANMPLSDCPALINWIPNTSGLQSRKGYTEWAFGIPSASSRPIKTVIWFMPSGGGFPAGTVTDPPYQMPGKVFAVNDYGIFDVTSATGAPLNVWTLPGTLDAGMMSYVGVSNSGGDWLVAASEITGYLGYDGTSWGTFSITGVSASDIVHVNVWKRRVWAVRRGTTKVYYLPVDAVEGAFTEFNFGPLFKRGGSVSFTANWTIDAGEGIDDFLVIVSSNGEVLVYKGTDPASVDTFSLVGTWYIGQVPVGRRGYVQYAGDLILLSADGVFPISYVTRGGADLLVASSKEYSTKIRPLLGDTLRATFTQSGWQMAIIGGERLLMVSTPMSAFTNGYQGAMSTSLNSWAIFDKLPINCMGVVAGYLMFGTVDGRVMLYYGPRDGVGFTGQVGTEITCILQMAFDPFGSPAISKRFHAVRPYYLSLVKPEYYANIVTDYKGSQAPAASIPTNAPTVGRWDFTFWDQCVWDGSFSGVPSVWKSWKNATGVGATGSAIVYTVVVAPTTLTQVDYMYEEGGPL